MKDSTPNREMQPGFVIWLTGLPASGKTTLARQLHAALRARGVHAVLLDSDALRQVLTPQPVYDNAERDRFYQDLVGLAELIARQGTPVIIAATGHRRRYRQAARDRLPRFLEVFVSCPREVCIQRDPKGLYAQASRQQIRGLPGADQDYEQPPSPEQTVHTDRQSVDASARCLIRALTDLGWLR